MFEVGGKRGRIVTRRVTSTLPLIPKLHFGNTYPGSSGFVMANAASGLFKVAITLRVMLIRAVPHVDKFGAGRGCSHFRCECRAALVFHKTGFQCLRLVESAGDRHSESDVYFEHRACQGNNLLNE